jgi:threonyl-tRNA synthetase
MFNSRIRSYRDLPLRLAEFGSCCRNESSGSLDGLMRLREFVQDDAHIFCTEEQIQQETIDFCNLLKKVYKHFGFESIKVVISTRPKNSFGSDELWIKAEKSLMDAMDILDQEYTISPGDGAFYGPKIEFSLKDRMDRYWQCGTFQLDFVLPQRMGASYINNQSQSITPVICHRAILGSIERFLGILLENTRGNLPFWLCPIQIAIVTIGQEYENYGKKIGNIIQNNYRIEINNDDDTLGKKIKNTIQNKIPLMIIVGQKEQDNGTFTLRDKKGNTTEGSMDNIINIINNFIENYN